MQQFKVDNLKKWDLYKQAMVSAAKQAKAGGDFCLFDLALMPDGQGKEQPHKPFLVLGKDQNALRRLLPQVKGAKKIISYGACTEKDGKLSFEPEHGKLPYNLLQGSKFRELLAGKMLHVPAGADKDERDGDDSQGKEAPPPGKLALAAQNWHTLRSVADSRVAEFKKVLNGHFAGAHPEVLREVGAIVSKIDAILNKLDHRLGEALKKAAAAVDPRVRNTELQNARNILIEYRRYFDAEKLIDHIDLNPLGVKTDLRRHFHDGLSQVEQLLA